MLSFPVLLNNIWLAWHLSGVKIACHLVSGHHAISADGHQRCSQRTAERYGRHLQRAGFTAGGVTGLTARPLGERDQKVKQEGQREGTGTPSPRPSEAGHGRGREKTHLDAGRQQGAMVKVWCRSQMDPCLNPSSTFSSCVTQSQRLTSLSLSVKPTLQGSGKATQSFFIQ